jgi:hypothetical protein
MVDDACNKLLPPDIFFDTRRIELSYTNVKKKDMKEVQCNTVKTRTKRNKFKYTRGRAVCLVPINLSCVRVFIVLMCV